LPGASPFHPMPRPPAPRIALPAGWAAARRRLLAWFDRHRRPLPWRADRDPYRVWVSEVMLQQTTVAAVVPYFERFVRTFPTVESLARADEQAVLKQWEGLGYYRRARHLHAAAKKIVAEYVGTMPADPAAWAALPGVGRYILGAVLSQAFELKFPIVEANTLRVLARLFGFRGDPRTGEGKTWVWAAAEAVLPNRRVGDFNQAMMELGALICTPAAPACDACPLATVCGARRLGIQRKIPPAKAPPAAVAVSEVAVAIRNTAGLVLVGRRPATVRWAGMWELPRAEIESGEDPFAAAARIARSLAGLRVRPGGELATIRHTVTRHAITVTAIEAAAGRGVPKSTFYDELRWVAPARLADLPAGTPQRKLFAELARPRRQLRLC
jgi:A/G-specific adenine glycosylase